MDSSMLGFPVHRQLSELAQTHVHQVSDAIQPSHPLFSPSPPAFNLSQHRSLFQWVNTSHQFKAFVDWGYLVLSVNKHPSRTQTLTDFILYFPLHLLPLWLSPFCRPAKLLQLCPTLCDPMDGCPPSPSVHWTLQARILEWVAVPSSRGSPRSQDHTSVFRVSYIFTTSAAWKPLPLLSFLLNIFGFQMYLLFLALFFLLHSLKLVAFSLGP